MMIMIASKSFAFAAHLCFITMKWSQAPAWDVDSNEPSRRK